jgi:hypothetical protein
VGFIAGLFPFVWAAWEFWKRIDTQQRCGVCQGSGLVSVTQTGKPLKVRSPTSNLAAEVTESSACSRRCGVDLLKLEIAWWPGGKEVLCLRGLHPLAGKTSSMSPLLPSVCMSPPITHGSPVAPMVMGRGGGHSGCRIWISGMGGCCRGRRATMRPCRSRPRPPGRRRRGSEMLVGLKLLPR